jgi:NTP pyrophosphatase (non-canonical NTP hydrolase)
VNFNEYQYKANQTALYPDAGRGSLAALSYVSLGLAGEAGEIANKIKKLLRDGDTPEKRKAISKEIGDCQWYLSQLCTELDTPLDYVASQNIDKLADRKERGVIQGNGDTR